VDLIPRGRETVVNSSNVYSFVWKYGEYRYPTMFDDQVPDLLINSSVRMITCQEKALEHIKLGLYDVIPVSCLEGLTPEDFRLLINGVSYLLNMGVVFLNEIYYLFFYL